MRNQTPIIIDWITRSITIAQDDADYRLVITATIGRNIIEGTLPMAWTITDSQFITLAVSGTTKKGNPAQFDGAPTWTSSDETILAISEVEGVTRASAVGPLGNAQVTVAADADLGEGTRTIGGVLDVTVAAGEAVMLTITPGVPQEQV